MCVLVSFSLSIPMVYALQYLKSTIYGEKSVRRISLSVLFVVLSVGATIAVCLTLDVDYGIVGCFLPVFASILYAPDGANERVKVIDTPWTRVLTFSVGCVVLSIVKGGVQIFALFAIPVLLLYSGKRGKWNIKYLFYLFYPLHLVVLDVIKGIV